MRLRQPTREKILKLIEKGGGRIGTAEIPEIRKLIDEDKLLDAFFSILQILDYRLRRNFHIKFHADRETHKIRDMALWGKLYEKVDSFSTLIFLHYSTNLIDKKTYDKLNKLKKLRNDIAHRLILYENTLVTKKEVKDAIEEGISLCDELDRVLNDIVFRRK